jgi:hypothetical protein
MIQIWRDNPFLMKEPKLVVAWKAPQLEPLNPSTIVPIHIGYEVSD